MNIIDSYKSEDDKTYTVVKCTPNGTFTGTVSISKDDEEFACDINGYRFAECKADIQDMRVNKDKLKQRYIEAKHLLYVAENSNNDQVLVKFLKHQMNIALRDYEEANKHYKTMRDSFRQFTDDENKKRAEFLKKYKEKQNK